MTNPPLKIYLQVGDVDRYEDIDIDQATWSTHRESPTDIEYYISPTIRRWRPEEIAILRADLYQPGPVMHQRILQAGYRRSLSAVNKKLHQLKYEKQYE